VRQIFDIPYSAGDIRFEQVIGKMTRFHHRNAYSCMHSKWRTLSPAVLVVISALASGCTKQQAAPPPRPAVPVVAGTVIQKVMPVEVAAVGNVEAYSTVSIKAQVPGQLLDVHFQEGDFVRKGQLLVTLDLRPYEAALAQAKAALARDKATAVNNRLQAQRYKKLLDEGIVPISQVESFTSAADASDAVLNADEAAIKTAELNLEYGTINSPIDGRTGALMLKPGNLVKVADVPIVVINQVNPIFVNFAVPQQFWPDIKKYMAQGTLRVKATIPQDAGPAEVGTLTFVDNAVDPTTGTIHLRATFTNSQNRLWPGLYVNVLLTLSEVRGATVVPARAILAGDVGSYVYIVRSDKRVEPRAVVPGRTIEGETVIEKGLQPGETIVLDGQVRLQPNARVEIKSGSGDKAPADSPVEH
jgi:multidrug efflux system membrane fusion protein